MRILIILFSLFYTISLTSCASIINEKTQRINVITSTGEKVKGTIDGIPFEAPSIVDVQRSNHDKILVTNDPKCNPTTIAQKSVDPIFFINILSGGVFGSTTDYVSEKMWKYQDSVTISCKN